MARLGTLCNECVFFDVKNEKCKKGILDKFIECGADIVRENGETKVDRICMYRRTPKWLNPDEDLESAMLRVDEEVYIHGSIIVLADDIESLKRCLTRLISINKIDKFKIIISHKKNLMSKEVRSICGEILKELDYLCIKVFQDANEKFVVDEGFRKSKNGFVFFIDSNKDFDLDIIEKINYYVNSKLERLIYVEASDKNIHESVCLSVVYKFLKGNKLASIRDKIEVYAEEAKCPSLIKNWNDINEASAHKSNN